MRSASASVSSGSIAPGLRRMTKCSRESTDSVFQTVNSTLLPPSSSVRISVSRSRTEVV